MTRTDQDPNLPIDDYESDLISIVAHDLKAPIGAVRGFIELTQYSGPINERQEHFLNRALMALTRMENLIASLLEFARLEAGMVLETSEVDLAKLISETFELLTDIAAQRGIQLHIEATSERTVVEADERLLGHVLTNLISNSIKYNREGGEVWVSISQADTSIQVDVRDNGIGIPNEAQHRVFERFYRAHRSHEEKIDGSGLGLAITQMIVQMHHGQIWVQSTPGVGSVFSFSLPLSYKKDAEADVSVRSPESGQRDSLFQPKANEGENRD